MPVTQSKTANFNRNRIIVILLFCVVIGGIFYMFNRLNIEAYRNKQYLNKMVILDGQQTKASARPDGDILTGSSAPAYAEFVVDDTLASLYEITKTNMNTQGYSSDGYADTSHANNGYQRVAIKYTYKKKSIVLEFNLKDFITCDQSNFQQKPCYFNGYVDVYGTGLQDKQVTKLKVFYDNN